jgi:hypothetical protein
VGIKCQVAFAPNMLDALKRETPSPIQLEAIRILERPEAYPGLRPLEVADSVVRLIEVPEISCYPVSVWLLQSAPSFALVRRVEWACWRDREFPESAPQTFGADADLPRDLVGALMQDLSRISIPPFRSVRVGLDGVLQTIEIWDGICTSSISWWRAPSEWRELSRWYDHARTTFEKHLPLSTSQNPQITCNVASSETNRRIRPRFKPRGA